MARYRHPRTFDRDGAGGFAVDIDGRHVSVEESGEFEADADADSRALRAIAAAHDTSVAEMHDRAQDGDSGTCDVVKSDGEVCGRDLPCVYHSDEDDS